MVDSSYKLRYATDIIHKLSVKPADPNKQIKLFSGGNQQKAVIGKWAAAKANVFIFIEPTAGVDVGAIKEIYDLILSLAESGAAIIIISSSVNEIISLSEKLMIIRDGTVVYEKRINETSEDEILKISMGGVAKN